MKTERVVLSFIAVVVGLLVAGIGFFIYESTKSISPSHIPTITLNNPTPTPQANIFLSIEQPADESVTDKRSITITGKTTPDATIILNSDTDDQIVTPSAMGAFSITTTISDGENLLTFTAVNKNGDETKKIITVTSSTEDF
jgi:hypothetical protein